uniref:Uncharacterized protein n=1 Tax=Strigamia maritima TaxID=126957 RepID=T1IK63_STRMM
MNDQRNNGNSLDKKQKVAIEDNNKQNIIQYSFTPATLREISSVKIVTELWCTDVREEMADYFNSHPYKPSRSFFDIQRAKDDWKVIENLVLDSVSKLSALPTMIRDGLMHIVKPIGNGIIVWINWLNQTGLIRSTEPGIYLRDLVWTSGGTIDQKETAKKLLANDRLEAYEDYELACTFCLIEYITTWEFFLSGYLNSVDIEAKPMVYFWTCCITKDKKLEEMANFHNNSVYEYVFQMVIKNGTDAAVKYLWNELSDEEKERNIIPATRVLRDADSVCFLLSRMNENQWREIFEQDDADCILSTVFFSWRWHKYLLHVMLNVWDISHERVFAAVLKTIAKAIGDETDKDKYRFMFTELWKCAPNHVKQNCLENSNEFYNIIRHFFSRETLDLMQLMLSSAKTKQKAELIRSVYGIEKCYQLLRDNEWDLFNVFIQNTLVCGKEVVDFKKSFARGRGMDVCNYYIENNEWDKVGLFLGRCLESEAEVHSFKHELASYNLTTFKESIGFYRGIYEFFLENAVSEYAEANFTKFDVFLRWCFEDDEAKIDEFKCSMFENKLSFRFLSSVCRLIENNKWDLIEDTLDWCFLTDIDRINKFKSDLMTVHYKECTSDLILELIRRDDNLKSFKDLVNWCFQSIRDVDKFSEFVAKNRNAIYWMCTSLLSEGKFELLNEFLNWIFLSSRTEVEKFKNELMICDNIGCVFDEDRNDKYCNFRNIVEWFCPSVESVETIIRFKEHFLWASWFKSVEPVLDKQIKKYVKSS